MRASVELLSSHFDKFDDLIWAIVTLTEVCRVSSPCSFFAFVTSPCRLDSEFDTLVSLDVLLNLSNDDIINVVS